MIREITPPESFALTENWHAIQYTNIHYNQPNVSQEYNKVLKSLGRGSSFVVCGFQLGLFESTIDGEKCCVARLSPGILVQDFTTIDFVQRAKESNEYIYVKVFGENNRPLPRQVFKLGSRYYHGIIGDGINSTPTYATFVSLFETLDRSNFKTLYSLRLTENYGSDGSVIDIKNIDVEDFRFPPLDRDPTDPLDPWYPSADMNVNYEHRDILKEDDYAMSVARSRSLMWSLALR